MKLTLYLPLLLVSACASPSHQSSVTPSTEVSPETIALVREVQSDYLNCMTLKLPEYDDTESGIAIVAASLREACLSEAEYGIEKLSQVEGSEEFKRALVNEYLLSLEGHSIRLVNRWRGHISYREPPYHRD